MACTRKIQKMGNWPIQSWEVVRSKNAQDDNFVFPTKLGELKIWCLQERFGFLEVKGVKEEWKIFWRQWMAILRTELGSMDSVQLKRVRKKELQLPDISFLKNLTIDSILFNFLSQSLLFWKYSSTSIQSISITTNSKLIKFQWFQLFLYEVWKKGGRPDQSQDNHC